MKEGMILKGLNSTYFGAWLLGSPEDWDDRSSKFSVYYEKGDLTEWFTGIYLSPVPSDKTLSDLPDNFFKSEQDVNGICYTVRTGSH